MNGESIITVSAATVALTQIVKWQGLRDDLGAVAVPVLAALGVGLWVFTVGGIPREEVFAVFAGWIAVTTSAAGVFGFTRAASSAVSSAKSPPGGAGQSPTT